ncbi:6-phosphogluconolactonase [soil metagenome]
MSFQTVVIPGESFAHDAARRLESALSPEGSIVITGGQVAESIYRGLAASGAMDWSDMELFFSDERCVSPSDPRSNYRLAKESLLDPLDIERVHRMRGEDPPERAAVDYAELVAPRAATGFDLVLLGMGEEGHICALFPSSPALGTAELTAVVDRPDGMQGITLTPSALMPARRIVIAVTEEAKAEAVARAVAGREPPSALPVRALARHPNVAFWLDEAAASRL